MSTRRESVSVCLAFALGMYLVVSAAWAASASGYEVYSVQPGDTLAAVAKRFGVSPSVIAESNGLPSDAGLRPGQSLTVPVAPAPGGNGKAQDEFAAEEKQAQDVEPTELTIKPASDARGGPVVGYLGVATGDTAAVIDPRRPQRLCAIARGSNLCVSCQYGDYYGILMNDGALAWVPKQSVALHRVELVAGVEMAAGINGRTQIVEAAFRYWGAPYLYGGTPPGPTDCSGLVQTAYRDCGMRLPRTAAEQFNVGYPVPLEQLAIGDRVYFFSSDGLIGHTGIYIGNGQFVHASSRRGYVGIDSLRAGFYRSRLAGARRP